MNVSMDFAAMRHIQWHQYLVRFVLGGTVTLVAGVLARQFGPVFGGLFLAFPAIFPASATLIAKRERQKKERQGLDGTLRGMRVAALDGAGTVIGAFALACFAGLVWKLLPTHNAGLVLSGAGLLWLLISVSFWWLRKKHWLMHRA